MKKLADIVLCRPVTICFESFEQRTILIGSGFMADFLRIHIQDPADEPVWRDIFVMERMKRLCKGLPLCHRIVVA
ncbi:MAG: hypothetical protein JW976_06645 [Syntrophaceae bacterium]|nr:hypothetical protein [Syntrophaceae bacterium]